MTQKGGPIARAASSLDDLERHQDSEAASERNPHPDDAGEDDASFFRARPQARTRVRVPFPGEFPHRLLKRSRGRQLIVVVTVNRHPVTGEPTRRARAVLFADGGRT